MRILTTAIVAAMLLGGGAPARAAQTISSPLLPWSGQLNCYVRNVGTTPVTVTVQLFGSDGVAITPLFEDCNGAPLAAGVTCGALASPATTAFAACSVTGAPNAKNLRANLEVRYGPVRAAQGLR